MDKYLYLPLTLGFADLSAVALLFIGWFAMGRVTEHPPASRPSVSVLMKQYRREWMLQFLTREPRIFDGGILSTLRDGTAFFASACMIATGGILALVSDTDQLRGLVRELDLEQGTAVLWEIKLLVAMFFVVNAFLKFAWAHRLFGYCAVMMAAVPNDVTDPSARDKALQAAELNITAARSFNAGLRSVYFALAGLAWLAGPLALLVATAVVLFVTWRREFASNSRQIILHALPSRDVHAHGEPQGSESRHPQP
ncbi:DUF599 domain-containing protein [Paracoccus seriniphilus]|uniref:Uncharacterized membrane protein n=1 Tax=Paracoccus seriniphilus TaxID=184748 RepID=A0A239PXD3_9RHOB|nr:DUF599 domain-containing protein [Paracoccus seriniphilus]WCR13064.1 DUF599 domain-containing protein [Paracoccus seriniphilus]SNT74748.1 Uncharacterized membrane protein [Paracoccus seriniphilus]